MTQDDNPYRRPTPWRPLNQGPFRLGPLPKAPVPPRAPPAPPPPPSERVYEVREVAVTPSATPSEDEAEHHRRFVAPRAPAPARPPEAAPKPADPGTPISTRRVPDR